MHNTTVVLLAYLNYPIYLSSICPVTLPTNLSSWSVVVRWLWTHKYTHHSCLFCLGHFQFLGQPDAKGCLVLISQLRHPLYWYCCMSERGGIKPCPCRVVTRWKSEKWSFDPVYQQHCDVNGRRSWWIKCCVSTAVMIFIAIKRNARARARHEGSQVVCSLWFYSTFCA